VNATNNENFAYLNTYSFPKFKKFCENLGVKKVESVNMSLDFDLSKKDNIDELSTYTLLTDSNSRLEITGNIILNWKLVILSTH
jgi:hypothetical protein